MILGVPIFKLIIPVIRLFGTNGKFVIFRVPKT